MPLDCSSRATGRKHRRSIVTISCMSAVTRILASIDDDPKAADELLPLVYQELRKLASDKLKRENPGQTIQATVLVHEAWLRLVGPDVDMQWNGRGHWMKRRGRWESPSQPLTTTGLTQRHG